MFLALFAIIQLVTLDKSPLPWFDETLFASIAQAWAQTGELIPQVAIFHPINTYGPLYFWFTGIIFKLSGISIFGFRMIAFIAGIACIGMAGLIFKQLNTENKMASSWKGIGEKLWWMVLLTDPLFYLVLHEGRMDLLALCFALSSIYVVWPLLLNRSKPSHLLLRAVASGILIALAALTTPRVCFIFVPLSFILWWYWRKQLWLLLVWGGVIAGIYSVWIYSAYGGWQGFLAEYLQKNPQINESLVGWFIGGVGYVPRQSYVLIITALLGVLATIVAVPRKLLSPWFVLVIVSIALFYGLVRDYGQYSVFILPFFYWLVFYGATTKPLHWKHWQTYPLLLLLIFNLGYFTLKNVQVLASLKQRDPQVAQNFVRKHIPKGARVVGEPMYLYAVLQAGSQYQYMNLYETLETREVRQRKKYQYQYLIVTDHLRWRQPKVVQYYLQKSELKKIARLQIPQSRWSQLMAGWGLSDVERTGYNCTIYQRLDAKQTQRLDIKK